MLIQILGMFCPYNFNSLLIINHKMIKKYQFEDKKKFLFVFYKNSIMQDRLLKTIALICIVVLGFSAHGFAQQTKTLTGTIYGENNETMPGAAIMVKGTSIGTTADADGKFTLKVPTTAKSVTVSFIGMLPQEVTIGTLTQIKVTLLKSTISLDEVVVVGYGVQKKKLVTGATVQIKGDAIQKMNTTSPLTALQSQTPGVIILKKSGEPGAGFKVNIRGVGTTGNSQPLYIVDGVSRGNIDYLNPSDIQSIDVLKDAASAAIYGSRASNGVILVTTKQGKAGKAVISYDMYYGVQNPYKILPLLNAQEYAMIQDEANVNSGLKPYDYAKILGAAAWAGIKNGTFTGTNWLKEMENRNAPIQSHALNITGGSEYSVYSIGVSYTSQDGIFGKPVASNYDRYTVRINTDHLVYKKNDLDIIKVGENLSFTNTQNHGIATGNVYWNDITNALAMSPFMPMWEKDASGNDIVGKYHKAIPWNTNYSNPIGGMVNQRGYNQSKNYSLNSNAYVVIQPIKGLKFRSSFGINYNSYNYRSFTPIYDLGAINKTTFNSVSQNMNMGLGWSFENTLDYDFKIKNHNISALIGTSAERGGLGEGLSVSSRNSVFEDFNHAYIDNANSPLNANIGGSPWDKYGLQSYFGRVNYDYKETYLLTLVMRADGSSNFAAGHRWGNFPSISGGWVLTNEKFMKSAVGKIDFLKVRASWGQNGNQSIPGFQYVSLINFNTATTPANYFFDPSKAISSLGAYPGNLPTPDLSWEISEQLDLGLDARFFANKLTLALDYYNKKTKNWLVAAPVLASWGVNNKPYINGGDITNQGVEVALNWNSKIGDFKYGVNANLGYNKNKVTRIANGQGIINADNVKLWGNGTYIARAQVGYPIGYFWGYNTAGIFQNTAQVAAYKNSKGELIMPTAQPGDVIFVDKNGDGIIDDKDKVMIGDPNPNFLYSFNFNCEYKGFDLAVITNGVTGNQIARSWHGAGNPNDNYTTAILGRWHGEGTSNTIPRVLNGSSINQQYTSDLDIENGDYLRISNVTLGYDLKKIIKKLPFQQLRFYVTVQNLYTFTKYTGMDPEIGTSTDDGNAGWVSGVDLGFYPNPRTVMFGASIKF